MNLSLPAKGIREWIFPGKHPQLVEFSIHCWELCACGCACSISYGKMEHLLNILWTIQQFFVDAMLLIKGLVHLTKNYFGPQIRTSRFVKFPYYIFIFVISKTVRGYVSRCSFSGKNGLGIIYIFVAEVRQGLTKTCMVHAYNGIFPAQWDPTIFSAGECFAIIPPLA